MTKILIIVYAASQPSSVIETRAGGLGPRSKSVDSRPGLGVWMGAGVLGDRTESAGGRRRGDSRGKKIRPANGKETGGWTRARRERDGTATVAC